MARGEVWLLMGQGSAWMVWGGWYWRAGRAEGPCPETGPGAPGGFQGRPVRPADGLGRLGERAASGRQVEAGPVRDAEGPAVAQHQEGRESLAAGRCGQGKDGAEERKAEYVPRRKSCAGRERREWGLAWEARGRPARECTGRGHHAGREGRLGDRCGWSGIRLGRRVVDCATVRGRGRRGCSIATTHERLVRLQLGAELLFGQHAVLDAGALVLGEAFAGAGDGACRQAEFLLLAPFVVGDVRCGYALHAEDLNFVTVAAWDGIFNAREPLADI